MKLSETCIRQPVLAIVLSLVIVVIGIMGYSRMEVLFFPEQVMPVVTIGVSYSGASPDLMESQVSTIIETELAGIDNIKYITSNSSTGYSSITVQFNLGGDLEAEANDVRDKVSDAIQYLPSDINTPVVTVGEEGAMLMGIAFTDDNKSSLDIRDYLNNTVKAQFQQLKGVGAVGTKGSTNYAMRIWLDPAKMAALNVDVADIESGLNSNNIYFPAGSLRGPTRNYSVKSDTYLKNADEFASIILQKSTDGYIRLSDVADVELGNQSLYNIPVRINNKEGIELTITPLQSANPITVAKEVRDVLPGIIDRLPPGMHAKLVFDNSEFLQDSIDETFKAIVEAVVLVIIVVLLFLGSLRSALIPIVTIPVSLIGVFGVIKLMGFSINIMSLLGMVLAIGLVVDDAIVVLENIERHIMDGMSALDASVRGIKEISHAVVVMTLTLVAVYAPLGFVQGITAALFQEFAFTLAAAVLLSGFIALTLSPMMCSRLLLSGHHQGRFAKILDRLFDRLASGYASLLRLALRCRLIIIAILIIIAVLGVLLTRVMSSEFLPQEDYGALKIRVNTPSGSTDTYTDKYTQQAVATLDGLPGIESVVTQLSSASSNIYVYLKPWNERSVSTQDLVAQINPKLAAIPGINAYAYIPDIVSYGEEGSDITLNFMTTQDYSTLFGPLQEMLKDLQGYPGIVDLQSSLKYDSQEYAMSIDRELASSLGVDIQDIADTVKTMMSGIHNGDIRTGSNSYEVVVQMNKKYLMSFDALEHIYVNAASQTNTGVRNPSNIKMIPLSSLIKLTPQIGQGSLYHFDRLRAGTISGMLASGYTESQVLAEINKYIPSVVNQNVRTAYSGKAQQFMDSAGSMYGIMLLSFVFIYLVLSAQFGSFIDPFIILLAVPLSLVGAIFSLWIGGGTFNLYSQIGLVTLVGLVSKHGILITEFTNQLRQQGVAFHDAIIQGAMMRLRPILMTTVAMVVGSIPLAIATGPGSIGRHQIGWVIVGGLIFGTFFSLIVVPVAYSYLGRFKTIVIDSD